MSDSTSSASARFHCVGATKLVLMTVSTLNVYLIFWFYKNWKAEGEGADSRWSNVFRALFCVVFAYDFCRRVEERAQTAGVPVGFSPEWVTLSFVLLSVGANMLPDPYWTIGLAAPVPLIPVQAALSRLNDARGFPRGPEARFRALNVIWLVIAGFYGLAVAIDYLAPTDPSA